MRKKLVNRERLEGRVYEHKLVKKTVQNSQSPNYGKEFITGTISVAVDDNGENIVENHFTYVSSTTKDGGPNATFSALDQIIKENKTWLNVGKDNAQIIKINTSIAVNDFINRNNEMVSAKRNEGGFVTLETSLNPREDDRHSFVFDIVINNVIRKEEDEENDIKEHVVIKGGVFNWRNEWQPIDVVVEDEAGMDYFEGLEASNKNPIFTQVSGTINGFKKINKRTVENAFGTPTVKEYVSNKKIWLCDWAQPETYDFGPEGEDLSTKELQEILQNREVFLANVKKKDEEYKASQVSAPSIAAAAETVQTGEFNF